jgi:mevalonate kinase
MPAISASAPGKVILFGEHSVVYGQPAIAVPVTQVKAKAIVIARPDKPAGWVNVQAPNIDLDLLLAELPTDDPLARAINSVFEALGITQPPAMIVRISSTIPIAAGLGSGAAVSVAIIRAVSEFLGRRLPDRQVSSLAFEVEKLHHGTPSGIDNTVITSGSPVYFKKNPPPGENTVETFQVAAPFTIVIADSGVSSPTAIAVGDVKRAWQNQPEYFETLFARIGAIVEQAKVAIQGGEIAALGPLMDKNQALLVEIGVSSPILSNLIDAAHQADAPGAKLSGAGRGGNMIALASSNSAQQISSALKAAGATNTIISEIKG